jgi:hypothetical protein
MRQHIMVGTCGEANLLTSWPEIRNEEEAGVPLTPSRASPLMARRLLVDPSSSRFSTLPHHHPGEISL